MTFHYCGAAEAEPSRRFDLHWLAPPSCPNGADVSNEVDELVANSAAGASTSNIAANAAIAAEPNGFALTLVIRDAEGIHDRRLEAPTCDELGHAAALIVALAIDPSLLANHPSPGITAPLDRQPPPVAEPVPMPSLAAPRPLLPVAPANPAPTVTVRSEAAITTPLAWRLGLNVFVGYRTLPGASLGTGLFGAFQSRGARLELGFSHLSADARSSDPSRGATFDLNRLATRFCLLVTETKWAAGPCAGVEVGRLTGSGYGVTSMKDRNAVSLGSSLGGLFELRIAPSSVLGVFADAEIPWVDYEFQLAGQTLIEQRISARFGIRLSAGWH